MTAPANAAPNESLSAAATRGEVATSQNPFHPNSQGRKISAAKGIRTIADSQNMVTPSANPKPGSTLGVFQRNTEDACGLISSSYAGSVDLVEYAAVAEMRGLRFAPAA